MENHIFIPEEGKTPVEILGATGSVGQRIAECIQRHPWFRISALRASDKSAGKKYSQAVPWRRQSRLDNEIAEMIVQNCVPDGRAKVAFSGLDSSVAGEIETEFARNGYIVVSNSKNHRMDRNVPLLIPEVNPNHLDAIGKQQFVSGKIVTNPNCSTIGIALALKPLQDAFGIRVVDVTTLQAASGAGYPGNAAIDLIDNIIPRIDDEQEKIRIELKKILGAFRRGRFVNAKISVDAQCTRVPVSNGHTACVKVALETRTSIQEVREAFESFVSPVAGLRLPSAPEKPLHFLEGDYHPQPRLHRDMENGMAVCVGQLQECESMDYQFIAFFDNLMRGAAGAAILNAELMVRKGIIRIVKSKSRRVKKS